MNPTEGPMTIAATGDVTTAEEIDAILEAAALRDDLPPNFHQLPVPERKSILGLTGPQDKEK